MFAIHRPSAIRRAISLASLVLALPSTAALAQASAQQFAVCFGVVYPTATAKGIAYFSNAFAFDPSVAQQVQSSFAQDMNARGYPPAAPLGQLAGCSSFPTSQAAAQNKQNLEVRYAGAQIVETGWQYLGAAPAAAPAAAHPAATTSAPGANIAPAQSITNATKGVQQGATQGVNQTVNGVESSTVGNVTSGINSTSSDIQNSVNQKISGLFHPKKKAPAAAPAAMSATPPAMNPTAPGGTAIGPITPGSSIGPITPAASIGPITAGPVAAPEMPAAPATPPAMTPPPAAAKFTLQDEGDGKHWVLTTLGQPDAKELVHVAGSKNAYLDPATGDKYIVLANGDITRIPHAATAR